MTHSYGLHVWHDSCIWTNFIHARVIPHMTLAYESCVFIHMPESYHIWLLHMNEFQWIHMIPPYNTARNALIRIHIEYDSLYGVTFAYEWIHRTPPRFNTARYACIEDIWTWTCHVLHEYEYVYEYAYECEHTNGYPRYHRVTPRDTSMSSLLYMDDELLCCI